MTKNVMIKCLLFSAMLVSLFITDANCEWIRTVYNYPERSHSGEEYLFDGDILLKYNVYTTYSSTYTACSWVQLEILNGNHSPSQNRGLSACTWDETFCWSGGNPPSNFQWGWRGEASHTCTARVYDTSSHYDLSEAHGHADFSVTVPNDSSSSSAYSGLQNAYAKSIDGQICAFNSFAGLNCNLTTGESASCIGNTGICSIIGATSGSGPYHRKGSITYLAATVMLNGDDEWGSATEQLSFWLP